MKTALLYIYIDKEISVLDLQEGMDVGKKSILNRVSIPIACRSISAKQGEFCIDGDRWYYADLSGKSTTMVNRKRLEPLKAVYLKEGDVISIGEGNDIIYFLFIESPVYRDYQWLIHPIGSPEVKSMGSLIPGTSLLLDDALVLCGNRLVFVQERPRIENRNEILKDSMDAGKKDDEKDSLEEIAQDTTRMTDDILHINIRERRAGKRVLLRNIRMDIKCGELVLILGGSGAGKTTFMNVASGYRKADADIMFNDIDFYEDSIETQKTVRLVPQYDSLRGNDTVFFTLYDVASTDKELQKLIPEEREKLAVQVLEKFGLLAEKDNHVSKLSGGQKKRLSIAVQYITEPKIFFLDEPDSGLDAATAVELMSNLRRIADEGRICILISHSPDRVANCFDKIIVLAKDSVENCGRLAFYGSPDEAYSFFETETLEAIVKKINGIQEGGDGDADYYIEKFNRMKGER